MGFPRQEYWSGLPFPPPADLPDPEIEPVSLVSPALAGGFLTTGPPGKPPLQCSCLENSMDRGSWRATVQGVMKSQTQLSD